MVQNKLIGRVVATEKNPTTIDSFTFWTQSDLILNPFDIVKVEHVNGSSSYGVIEEISHITDATSFLTNYISSDFGDLDVEDATMRIGMNYVSAKVVCNDKNIYIPLQNNAKVLLATKEEITYALGLKSVDNPLICGYLEMYEGTQGCEKVQLPVHLNSKFIIGPEGAHLNISGISGLAAKTSYAMFLLKAIQDKYLAMNDEEESVAFVLFNVKGKDLLAIDQPNDFSDEERPKEASAHAHELYQTLGLKPEPFKQVSYFHPYSEHCGKSNSYLSRDELVENAKMNKSKFFKYLYPKDKKTLDLLFANIDDTNQTIESILNYISNESDSSFIDLGDWDKLRDAVQAKTKAGGKEGKEINVMSWRKFYRLLKKATEGCPFFARRLDDYAEIPETRLEDAIKQISKNDVYVVDIAKLSEDQQAYVFGSVMRSIYNLQLGEYDEEEIKPPRRIVVFIDELNKYASKDAPKNSPILRQILDVAERGRSLGVVLFGAEQFRSAINNRVTGNCSTHAFGRSNTIEVGNENYKSIPPVYKNMITRLKQGEYILQNPLFRSLLHIKFPKPIYRQFK